MSVVFKFLARSGEQTMPLEVTQEYRPGKQSQRARRYAVGELLARLDAQQAIVDASGEDMIQVKIDGERWTIE